MSGCCSAAAAGRGSARSAIGASRATLIPSSRSGNGLRRDGSRLYRGFIHFTERNRIVNAESRVATSTHAADDSWTVAGRTFRSRLIVGTGKYRDFAQNAAAVEASGAEIVTVAVRRVNISDPRQPVLIDFIDPKTVTYLPNTAGCFTADEAVRTLRLAREAGGWSLVKLEVLGEAKTLYPDMRETLKATETLVREGF